MSVLRGRFAGRSFTAREASRLLREYSKGTVYRLLSDLTREGKLTKMGYALYRAEPRAEGVKIYTRTIPPDLGRAKELLDDTGVRFMLTGYSVLGPFIHLFPRRVVHLIYVVAGSGETALEALEREGYAALLNPKTVGEVNVALGLSEGDLFVVREKRELLGNTEGGIASVERSLIDLYFESTRRRIPFPEGEVGRIMRNALKAGGLDLSRMTKLASRRGVAGEIRAILRVEGGFPSERGEAVFNEHVKAVLPGAVR